MKMEIGFSPARTVKTLVWIEEFVTGKWFWFREIVNRRPEIKNSFNSKQ
jgi:hypothetical protein